MAANDEKINLTAGANVKSIQININLEKAGENLVSGPITSPKGSFVRHAFLDVGANPVKKVRLSYIPDSAAESSSTNIFNANPGEPTKWLEMLGDPAGLDLDEGVTVLRISEDSGTITWLPANTNQDPISLPVKQKAPDEPGGVSIGDFIACWIANGADAAAAAQCLDRL